ncbi:glycosyltransferase [Saccharicrinis aurantiacus]|uniref:glycosyltransferase n=1 Tax=Saccharicrinis aurantiacus TaxID=1849719 RepID=UPI002490D3E2|nr:glycosyltransferase [Saccharicrinis aurantiacus]
MNYSIDFFLDHQTESILLGICIIAFLIQIIYYLRYYLSLAKYKDPEVSKDLPPVSVIICARNESKNLENNLYKILSQEYPSDFEVVVVNDASEDDSELVLAKLKREHTNLYYTTIPHDRQFSHGKKLALTLGVKAAKNEHLIFTDADCVPQSNKWLCHMANGLLQKDIVLGVGLYKKRKGLSNLLLRYDTFMIAVQYISFAIKKKTYMGVGRNMAYTKKTFYDTGGFKSHSHILSGDDDLFIQEAATKNNVAIVTNPDSFTLSESPNNFSEWCNQKKRHLTTSKHYKNKSKRLIGIEIFSRQLFWASAIISMFFSTFANAILIVFFLKLLVQFLVLGKISRNMGQKNIIWIGILLDFVLPIITGVLLMGSKRKVKSNRWT